MVFIKLGFHPEPDVVAHLLDRVKVNTFSLFCRDTGIDRLSDDSVNIQDVVRSFSSEDLSWFEHVNNRYYRAVGQVGQVKSPFLKSDQFACLADRKLRTLLQLANMSNLQQLKI